MFSFEEIPTQHVIPQIEVRSADRCTALDVHQKLAGSGPSFLLDGAGWFGQGRALSGVLPFAAFRSRGACSTFSYFGADGAHPEIWHDAADPIVHLQRWLDRFTPPDTAFRAADRPLAHGGAIGFFSYDLVRQFERVPKHHINDPNLPDILLFFFDLFIVSHCADGTPQIVFDPFPRMRMGQDAQAACRVGEAHINAVQQRLQTPQALETWAPRAGVQYDLTPAAYEAYVRRVLGYIAAGDVFQVNLSHSMRAPGYVPAASIYRRLSQINPSPFSAYLDMGEVQVACGSPERLVCVRKREGRTWAETWPIAGTRPRGRTPEEDQAMVAALYASRKEQAEHLMLVDLARNDLGRVCRFGSVDVTSLMGIEKYSHVIHLVSRVCGEVAPGTPPLSVLRALFPGGTITGVPKIRCMEIIAELEVRARGIYTGAIGYIGFDGQMDLNIAIRTWVRYRNEWTTQVGGGIVADSDPAAEYQETLQKAAALIAALQ